jgi:hypothetical protein
MRHAPNGPGERVIFAESFSGSASGEAPANGSELLGFPQAWSTEPQLPIRQFMQERYGIPKNKIAFEVN